MRDLSNPTPWHIDEHGDVRDNKDSRVAIFSNRDLITRAANQHDGLLGVLAAAKDFAGKMGWWGEEIFDEEEKSSLATLLAAIAKAEGTPS
jgi:hypothetical protein